ncbi:hypothetical protein K432DRAFT_99104 [Lepidopterella palustris CBS 459.81]|uniref:Protein kinase domain-containing protein n=1 Tax=Lepidopterella palustris CBS 459.81 TaxID=1314670 RepID=A0A8E2E6B8_9PEZI|nr:hypothetical protein K432DRAFT_99104 [Lepidopterella palustris CBS 459.81]
MDESTPLPGLGPRAQQSSINSALGPSPLSTTIVHVEHQAGANNPPEQQLPPLLGILDIFLRQNETGRFFSETSSLNDVQFSGQRPIVGVGHHFVVYASPFSKLDTVPDRAAKVGAEVFCIKSPNMTSRTEEEGFRNEYYHTVLQELRVMTHPDLVDDENIIGLLGLDFQEDYDDFKLAWPLLLMEYAEFGTLDAFQHDSNGLQPELSRNLLLDVALGLRSLHSCNIIHGDVKSENVLVCGHSTRQYVAKLSDFGLAVVNPSKEKKHYLPGCTWLWSAPEARDELSVHGMQLTDVYSFGLTVWRVLLNCDDPFEWIARSTTTIYNQHNFVDQIKSNIAFPQMILQTFSDLRQQNPAPLFAGPVITSTLSLDPSQRDIEAAILVLSEGSTTRGKDVFSDHQLNNQASWDLETPEAVMTTLADAFPWEITKCFMARPSVFYLLIQDLEIVMSWNSTTSLLAANLCFEIIISPQIQIGDKGVKNSSRLLSRLCELGSQAHRSIAHLYCKLNQTEFRGNFDLSWLEDTVWQGSYFAIQTLQTDFPDRYLEWKSAVEGDASRECLGSAEDYQRMLIAYCRTGNIKQCHAMLDAGASAFTDWDEPGPLHFLAMSNDAQAPAVASRLIDAGAALDHWEGNHSDDILLFDKPSGTPLHWAVWHRNLPLIRVLTERDYHPDEENAKRAVLVAAAMYLYDALEILLDWITIRNPKILSSEWITSLLSTATVHVLYHLPRFLRHGNKVSIAMSQTFEQLLQIHAPPTAELITSAGLVSIAAIQNHAELFRYLIVRFELYATKNGSRETFESIHANCLMSGFIDIFDILYEHRFFPLDHLFGTDKFTGMQVCLAVRQRNLYFIGRFLEWGCPVDGMGVGTVAEWTPFAMAVQCGLYDIANLLLQHGANKEFTTGWLGGTTPLFRMLHSWPDVPISRVKYLLQEVPRQGFGHVSFIGWPANGANVLYSFAMAVWSHYRSSYKFTETMKYVLSMMADKSCLNTLDRTGCTALNMAARSGNLEVARTLIEAGADVNGGLAISPLNAAMDWREKWVKKEREAMGRSVVGERRHATKIRMRAEELIQLLRMNGARERGFMENQRMMISTVTSGNFKLPSAELLTPQGPQICQRKMKIVGTRAQAH